MDEALEKQKSKDIKIFFALIELIILLIAVTLIGVCGHYEGNYYNTLTCNMSSVTPIDSSEHKGSIYWYFQYDLKNQDCDDWDTATVYNTNYNDAVDDHNRYSNKTTITCYTVKGQDQCNVFSSAPHAGDFWAGIIIGIILLLLVLICMWATFCDRH